MVPAPERPAKEAAHEHLPLGHDPTTGRRRVLTAILIFFLVAAVIIVSARGPGLTWDEAIYCGLSYQYLSWFKNLSGEAFRPEVIQQVWAGQAHPPLGKLWIASFLGLLGNHVDIITAIRIGAAVLFALCGVGVYLWMARRRGEVAGLIAAAAFVLMPRLFGHGHFANLEMLMVLLWLTTIIAFERGIRSGGWSVACGILFGLALLTKINAVFLPIILAPWGLVFHGRKAWRNLIFMAVIGPVMFVGGWPAMWHDPIAGVHQYLADKAGRWDIPTYYLGKAYSKRLAPFHYPFVMLLATTPLPILAAAIAGACRFGRMIRVSWKQADHECLLLAGCLFPILLLAVPGVPRYDGIRLMLPAYPFLAMLAAEGTLWAWEKCRPRFKNPVRVARKAAVLLAFWLMVPIVGFHPFHLCYYSELVGGPWGAHKLGFETTYWNETFDHEAIACLNMNVPANGRVAFEAMGSMVWQYYRMLGEARGDIRIENFDSGAWDYLVVIPRQGWLAEKAPRVKDFMDTHDPAWVNSLPPMGMPPICYIYRKP